MLGALLLSKTGRLACWACTAAGGGGSSGSGCVVLLSLPSTSSSLDV